MAKTVLNVKTDMDVKQEAQKLAKQMGIPLSVIVNAYLKKFITEKRVEFSLNNRHVLTFDEIKERVIPIFKKYGISYSALYGSYARGEATPESDVDLLVEFGRPLGYEYIDLRDDLVKELGRDVDVITDGSMNSYLRKYIVPDLKPIYGEK